MACAGGGFPQSARWSSTSEQALTDKFKCVTAEITTDMINMRTKEDLLKYVVERVNQRGSRHGYFKDHRLTKTALDEVNEVNRIGGEGAPWDLSAFADGRTFPGAKYEWRDDGTDLVLTEEDAVRMWAMSKTLIAQTRVGRL